MKSTRYMQQVVNKCLIVLLGSSILFSGMGHADPIPSDVQAKVEKYKHKLVEWAANPVIIAAIKEANAKGAGGMNNATWNDLAEDDPKVKALKSSSAGKLLTKWEEDKGINKLYIRDEKANLVAGSNKALLFNNASRPQFSNAIKGEAWVGKEMKPDPTTQIMSVQLSVPILEGGKTIGVMNSSVSSK